MTCQWGEAPSIWHVLLLETRWIRLPFSFTAHVQRTQNEKSKYNGIVRQEIVMVSLGSNYVVFIWQLWLLDLHILPMFWYDCKFLLQQLIPDENVSRGVWEDWCNYCIVRLILIMHRNIKVSLLLLLITMGTLISDVLCDNRNQRFKRRVVFIKGSKFFVSVNDCFQNVVQFYTCVIRKITRKGSRI